MSFSALITVSPGFDNIKRNLRGMVRFWLADIRESALDAVLDRVVTPTSSGVKSTHVRARRKIGNRRYENERTAKGRLKGRLKPNAGRAYDDTALPLNADSTIAVKARHAKRIGGGLWSLVDKGILTDRTKWRRTWPQAFATRVAVPAEREAALRGLNEKGYKFAGIPRTIQTLRPSEWAQLHLADLVRDWSRRGYPRMEAR